MTTAAPESGVSIGVGEARPIQVYTTTVYAKDAPPTEFVWIPEAALDPDLRTLDGLVAALDLRVEREAFHAKDLPAMLWWCLTEGEDVPSGDRVAWAESERRMFVYCEYLAFSAIVPVESSPLEKQPNAGLMATGAALGAGLAGTMVGAKVGVGTGIVIGAAGGPVVILTAIGGFVIGGAIGAVTGIMGEYIAKLLGPHQERQA